MNVQTIRDRTKAELRALILTTARNLFVHQGYESFSLRKVAHEIGYSPAAIYKHFSSKNEIFESLTEESFAALVQASAAVTPTVGEDPVEGSQARNACLCKLWPRQPRSLPVCLSSPGAQTRGTLQAESRLRMVLLETRGLWLYSIVRGGIG
jgi:AcrR family transcriptional regulator